ncbi:MAG: peptidoglycan DD-metalloendopeptidase family protein [Candidatus Magasanikbacteria bacterium]|nr:peptidoglycan DD-metalloendopeptidase family protein [Candidatus Magasanikbacteria bacterium]
MNKRRGKKTQFLSYFLFCLFISIIFGKNAFANQEIAKFLILPFSSEIKLLQGWEYTMLVRGNKTHGAIDYDCNLGDPIYASYGGEAMASVQVEKKSGAGYGNFVFIKHDNGYATLYGHLDKTAEYFKYYPSELRSNTNYSEWTPVEKGDYIGECGTSGTDNVHLHFEVTTGKYSTGRIDSYDLYKTKQFYPPNASYTTLGEKHLWMTDPPEYREAQIATNQTSGTVEKKKSILDTIKHWFAPDAISEQETEKNAQVEEEKKEWGLSFVDRKISVLSNSGEEILMVVRVKNTGSRVWKKNEISLNVIGGREINSVFRHPSWITDLRPALLDNTDVKPGETGSFSFSINSLNEGSHTLKLMAVEVGAWKQIGVESVEILIVVGEGIDNVIEETTATSTLVTEKVTPFEGIVQGIKEFAGTVVDKVVDVINFVPKIFRGGGGGSSSSNENNQSVVENPAEDPSVVEEEGLEGNGGIESIPEISREIILNEIAWSGSSRVCTDREWIELYNTSETVKSLENWTLDIHTSDVTSTVALTGSIEVNGYYLISHADTFSPLVTTDSILHEETQIPNNGARLVLKNQDGEIVDMVDQSLGWVAGAADEYPKTLERVASSTWKSSDSVRYGVQSGNCGQFTGSPRMENNGFAYISDETLGFYPRDTEGNVLLTREENPYIFSSFTIAENDVVKVGPGVVFAGTGPESRIKVQGELVMKGEENDPIVVTSRHDQEIVVTSTLFSTIFTEGLAQAGDWQHIEVVEGGKLSIDHGVLRYGGNRFGTSAFCQGCSRSQVITNLGGEVVLQNVEIGNGFELGNGAGPDALVYASDGMLNLQNVALYQGKRALHSEGNTEVSAKSVDVYDFDLLDKVIYFDRTMPVVWEDVDFLENTPAYAYSPALVVTSSYTFSPDHIFEFGVVSIESGGELVLDGGNLYAREITVKGKLRSGENESMSEIAGGVSSSSTFSRILFSVGSSGNLKNVTIRGGGYFQSTSGYPFSSPRPYMIWVDGATVSISHSQLIDSRRPGGIMVVRNGNVDIQDTEMGWNNGYNKLSSFVEYGMVLNTQSVGHIENVNFRKMDYVVELNQGSTLTHDRMSEENLIDLYPAFFPSKNWFPGTIFPF